MHSQSQFAMASCFILLSVLPLVASQSGGQSFSSYSDWLETVPSCAQDCVESFFSEFVEYCEMDPSSTSPSNLRCFCVDGGASISEAQDIGEETAQCASRACSSTTNQQQFGRSMLDLAEWCNDIAGDGVSVSNSEDEEDSGKYPVRLLFFLQSFLDLPCASLIP